MSHERLVQSACDHALKILTRKKLTFRPMRRRRPLDPKKGFTIGRTNLKTGLITIDIFTPRKREPKKLSSVLRTLAHEVAHHQKKPYRQRFRGKWIIRQHYPGFYRQVNKNIEKLRRDAHLKDIFRK